MKIDTEQLARELIRFLRGHRSQVQFSRRLGYTTNTVYSWEAGRRWPRATTFFAAAARVGIELEPTLRPFYRRVPGWLSEETGSAAWLVRFLVDLRGNTPIGTLAQRCGASRFAVSRWLKGTAQPRLPEFLRLVEAASHRLLDFVALFVDPGTLDSTRDHWNQRQAVRDLAWRSPSVQLVVLALELEAYRSQPAHSAAWLAGHLGLQEAEVTVAVESLERAGQLSFDGTHYRWVEAMALDLRGSGSALKRHWAKTAAERLDTPDAMFSYNLFTIDEAHWSELRELQRAHYRAVRNLVAQSSRAERLVLMNLQLVPLDQSQVPTQ